MAKTFRQEADAIVREAVARGFRLGFRHAYAELLTAGFDVAIDAACARIDAELAEAGL